MAGEFSVVNPATEARIRNVQRLSLPELLQAGRRAKAAQIDWMGVGLQERMDLGLRVCSEIEKDAEVIARGITLEMGKPIVQARAEVRAMLFRARAMVAQAPDALRHRLPAVVEGFERFVERRPHGAVLDMAAWNYPLLIAVNVVLPAIVAGNAVLLKHSARTPGVGEAFAVAFERSGAPEGLVQAIQADHPTILAFAASELVDYVAFTGSVEGGRAVQAAVRDRFVGLGLELGGKDGAYVSDEAEDLGWIAQNLAEGFAYNCGQSCCAVERIYVHRRVYERFLPLFLEAARAWVPGDPLAETTNLGPLVSEAARRHIVSQAQDARRKGVSVLLEGGPTSVQGRGYFFAPEVFANTHHDMSLMRDETFGPIVGVMKVDSDDEAVRLMNDSAFALTASVWAPPTERSRRVLAALSAGTVFLNRCDYLDPMLPWTGHGDSGFGSTLGHEGYLNLTRPRSHHLRLHADARGA